VVGLLSVRCARAQESSTRFEIRDASDSVVQLSRGFIDPGSIRIVVDSSLTLQQGDFVFVAASSSLVLSAQTRTLLFPTSAARSHQLVVRYFELPISLKRSYSKHELRSSDLNDSLAALLDSNARTKHPARIAQHESPILEDPFINHFQKSGSIARGFQLGSNRDLALTSGFNLQFSGDLAKDVSISGALTEETTPIQPEGNTQTLHDVDRVFIRMNVGQHLDATFGDFVLDLNEKDLGRAFQSNTNSIAPEISAQTNSFSSLSDVTFTNFSRKLLGVEAGAHYGSTALMFSGASARGKYATNTIQGQEAFQGPYRLSGKDGEPVIVVIAGTERVYVDGVLQTRGERNDYVIDYALGQIVFQPRRLITSASRITVDFQYTSDQYSRSFFAGEGRTALFDSMVSFAANFVREGDNPDAPLQVTLSDSDKAILASAGNDPSHAVKSGVTVVPRSATGAAHGSYVKLDSIVNGSHVAIFSYAPLDTINAIYNVTFGFAGTGRGSYLRQGIGQYQYAGAGYGDYDTLNFLPLPQLTQVLDLVGTLHPFSDIGVSAELAGSQFTANRFAPIATQDIAYTLRGLFLDTLRIGGASLGSLQVRSLYRQIRKDFTTVDRVDDVEFLRRYGIDAPSLPTTNIDHREQRSENILSYTPTSRVTLEGGYGNLAEQRLGFDAKRIFATASSSQDSNFLPSLLAHIEQLNYTDTSAHELGNWYRDNFQLGKVLPLSVSSSLELRGRYDHESRIGMSTDSIALTGRSFKSDSWSPEMIARFFNRITITGSYEARGEDSVRNNALQRLNNASTYRLSAALTGLGGFSSNLDLTVRHKHYLDSLSLIRAGGDQSTLLLRFEPRYTTLDRAFSVDGVYEITNQKAARLERVFLAVQPGLGSYKYIGDKNGNGKPDPEEFQLARYADQANFILIDVPTTTLFPTIDLRSSARVHFDASPLISEQEHLGLWASILRAISFESAIRVEETSTDENENDIYLFRLSHFQNDQTTLHGIIEIDQDLFILANDPDRSFRLRFFERRGAAQFNTGLERTYVAERSIRGRFKPVSDVTNETTIAFTTDVAISNDASYNRPHSTAGTSLISDWSYHPAFSVFDYGVHLEGSIANERNTDPNIQSVTDAVTARMGYALETKTRLRAELERDELTLNNSPTDALLLPYSLTNGRAGGTTWLWKLAIDYNLGSGILATVSYDGRNAADPTTGDRRTVHNGRAEIRASF
jgi:hypothetical protein